MGFQMVCEVYPNEIVLKFSSSKLEVCWVHGFM